MFLGCLLPIQADFIGSLEYWLAWRIAEPLAITGLRAPLLQRELIRDHSNELAIGWLVLLGRHAAAERLIERVGFQRQHFIAIITRHLLGFSNEV